MALTVMVPIAEPGVPITPYELAIDPARFAGAIGFVGGRASPTRERRPRDRLSGPTTPR